MPDNQRPYTLHLFTDMEEEILWSLSAQSIMLDIITTHEREEQDLSVQHLKILAIHPLFRQTLQYALRIFSKQFFFKKNPEVGIL